MRIKIIIVLLLLLSGTFSTVFCQIQKQFSGDFCKPLEAPMLVLSGEHVVVLCDTAFVINKYRMHLYEVSKEMILKNNSQNVNKLIKAYDHTLMVVSGSYDSLLFNYRKLDELFRTNMDENRLSLNNSHKDLEKATNSLNSTENMLNEAVSKLGERDKNGWKKKVAFFGGGLLTGVLIMLFIN